MKMMMMHMTLYWGKSVTLLVDSWKTDSWPSYLLTLFACFLFSTFYQYMEDRRLRFKSIASTPSAPASTAAPLIVRLSGSGGGMPARFVTAVLFGVNSAIGYLLMLSVMSYNGGVLLAIVLGLSVGYFVFRAADEEVLVLDSPCACA